MTSIRKPVIRVQGRLRATELAVHSIAKAGSAGVAMRGECDLLGPNIRAAHSAMEILVRNIVPGEPECADRGVAQGRRTRTCLIVRSKSVPWWRASTGVDPVYRRRDLYADRWWQRSRYTGVNEGRRRRYRRAQRKFAPTGCLAAVKKVKGGAGTRLCSSPELAVHSIEYPEPPTGRWKRPSRDGATRPMTGSCESSFQPTDADRA